VGVVALVLHRERNEVVEQASMTAAWLAAEGHEVRLTHDDATIAGLEDHGCDEAELAASATVAVSLGGDGTMLRTVRLVARAAVPVIGVNYGQMGYLTEIEPERILTALERFFAGDYGIEERMMLDVRADAPASGVVADEVALNEAVLEKTYGGRTVRLDVSFGGAFFTAYTADGLIVATPTGSTAYAFSARGPIIAPTHAAMLLAPVSPHMLFDRCLVLEPDDELRIEVASERAATLAVDGRILGNLEQGDAVICSGAAQPARLVVFAERDFHRVLKSKFGLAER
jgi:NAD+ kinase